MVCSFATFAVTFSPAQEKEAEQEYNKALADRQAAEIERPPAIAWPALPELVRSLRPIAVLRIYLGVALAIKGIYFIMNMGRLRTNVRDPRAISQRSLPGMWWPRTWSVAPLLQSGWEPGSRRSSISPCSSERASRHRAVACLLRTPPCSSRSSFSSCSDSSCGKAPVSSPWTSCFAGPRPRGWVRRIWRRRHRSVAPGMNWSPRQSSSVRFSEIGRPHPTALR